MRDKKTIETRLKHEEDLGFKILGYLRRITRAIDLNSKRLSVENNLTSPQTFSLITIYHKGPLTLAEVANKVHLSPSTMVGIVDRLEAKNLVIRERSKTDKRQVRIKITEEGKKAVLQRIRNVLTKGAEGLPFPCDSGKNTKKAEKSKKVEN